MVNDLLTFRIFLIFNWTFVSDSRIKLHITKENSVALFTIGYTAVPPNAKECNASVLDENGKWNLWKFPIRKVNSSLAAWICSACL